MEKLSSLEDCKKHLEQLFAQNILGRCSYKVAWEMVEQNSEYIVQ